MTCQQRFQLLQYVTEAYGRKIALYLIWVDLVIVSEVNILRLRIHTKLCSSECFYRILCHSMAALACRKTVFGNGRWHVAIYTSTIPI